MADLTITAASVLKGTGASVVQGTAGASITAGQCLYLDTTTSTYKLTDNNSATVAARACDGISLHAAASGQPIQVLTGGPVTIGATLTQGVGYYSSPNAGGIAPVADIVSGCYPTFLGFATSTTVLTVSRVSAGVVV